jgi:hypothetical protein
MKYLILTLTLLGAAYATTFVPAMYPCPFDKEAAYRHEACTYEENTIICSYSHTHHSNKGPIVHQFTIQFPYGSIAQN